MDSVLQGDVSRMNRALDRLVGDGYMSLDQALRKYSTIFANTLIMRTQPFGQASRAQGKGEGAVKRDIGKVYLSHPTLYGTLKDGEDNGEALAQVVYGMIKSGNYRAAERLLGTTRLKGLPIQPFDSGQSHRSRRNSRGRVTGRGASMIPQDDQARKEYVKRMVGRVGFSKAGWLNGFEKFHGIQSGKLRVPIFVRRHVGRAPGRVWMDQRPPRRVTMWFENHVPWIRDIFKPGDVDMATRGLARRMERDVEREVIKRARRLGLQAAA